MVGGAEKRSKRPISRKDADRNPGLVRKPALKFEGKKTFPHSGYLQKGAPQAVLFAGMVIIHDRLSVA